ncbi:hypothetical protein TrST_g4137 [Triparma strigata]|uniref:Uncharacterized protein n=1 Tax=Triparma strigata TaxID=1606541 RepID=A0A9W6ZSF1_9STRA|nr:hypothetical protein TrST_g4137 [Triparma strigata]
MVNMDAPPAKQAVVSDTKHTKRRQTQRRRSFSSMMLENDVGSLDQGQSIFSEHETMAAKLSLLKVGDDELSPVKVPGPASRLEALLDEEEQISPVRSDLASMLSLTPNKNVGVGGTTRRRSYDNSLDARLKTIGVKPKQSLESPVFEPEAFDIYDALGDEKAKPKPHRPPGGKSTKSQDSPRQPVLTNLEGEKVGGGNRGRRSFGSAIKSRPAKVLGADTLPADLNASLFSVGGEAESGDSSGKVGVGRRRSFDNMPVKQRPAAIAEQKAIQQGQKTRDKQRNAEERRKSFEQQRRKSLSDVNQLKLMKINHHTTKEIKKLREEEIRIAPVQMWLKYLVLVPRHDMMVRIFKRKRAILEKKRAAARIQQGWRERAPERKNKYAGIFGVLQKHRERIFGKITTRRKEKAMLLAQKWLTHIYRHKRFNSWAVLIRLRTSQTQKLVRSWLACSRARLKVLKMIWANLVADEKFAEEMRGEALKFVSLANFQKLGDSDDEEGDEGHTRSEFILPPWKVELALKRWLKMKRKEFVTSMTAEFQLSDIQAKKGELGLKTFDVNDIKSMMASSPDSGKNLLAGSGGGSGSEGGEQVNVPATVIQGCPKMKPTTKPRKTWKTLPIFADIAKSSRFKNLILETYSEAVLDADQERKVEAKKREEERVKAEKEAKKLSLDEFKKQVEMKGTKNDASAGGFSLS